MSEKQIEKPHFFVEDEIIANNDLKEAKLNKYLVKTAKEFEDRVKNKENVMILAGGEERKGMSSLGIPISKYINQVFDEELAKITNKNITNICKEKK